MVRHQKKSDRLRIAIDLHSATSQCNLREVPEQLYSENIDAYDLIEPKYSEWNHYNTDTFCMVLSPA